jgi:SAM-dependent methyltransferase
MDYFLEQVADRKEQERYRILCRTLEPLRALYEGKSVLDFGASHGPGICALLERGAAEVIGVEPGGAWVEGGLQLLRNAPFTRQASLLHIEDTRELPFPDARFDVVLVNAVMEHIPQPRTRHIREIWRVLKPSGHLIVNETPNKYLPKEVHTTGLWFIHWLPSAAAHRYAVWRKRFRAEADWQSSGWRGLGYYELVRALPRPYTLHPESSHTRHRVLTRVGLPASLLDPYPTWVLEKA